MEDITAADATTQILEHGFVLKECTNFQDALSHAWEYARYITETEALCDDSLYEQVVRITSEYKSLSRMTVFTRVTRSWGALATYGKDQYGLSAKELELFLCILNHFDNSKIR